MRIAITVDPNIPVPPRVYGGIERVVNFVASGLARRGHTLTVFAHPDSVTPGELVGYGVPPHLGRLVRVQELSQLAWALFRRRRQFDVVISWGRLAALIPLLPLWRLPKIQRYCRDSVPWRSIRIASALARTSISFVGASDSVYSDCPESAWRHARWRTIHDGVEIEKYPLVPKVGDDAPLVFLGRIEPRKGVSMAIDAAKAAARRLIIAGNKVTTPKEVGYFEYFVAPHIDNDQIQYIGPVTDAQKASLLGQCAAMLFPTQYKEGFGIVMAEAMACGVPVLASPNGSVPEIIREGKNGFLCRTLDDYVAAIKKVCSLDRRAVREDCECRFSSEAIVNKFEVLCSEMVEQCRAPSLRSQLGRSS